MQVSYELKFHLLRWTKKTNFDLSSSGICSRVWRTSSCPPSLPGNIGSELESTSRTCYGETVKKVLSMMTGTHLVCDCARLMIYEDLLGDVHSVSIFEISNLLMILWSECFASKQKLSHLLWVFFNDEGAGVTDQAGQAGGHRLLLQHQQPLHPPS